MEKDLSFKLMGCFYKVRNVYGCGHREKIYDRVLDEVLVEAGLKYVNKPKITLYSFALGKPISSFIPDKLIENKILVEIKAKPFVTVEDLNQMREYIKITKYEIIYLVNFGLKEFKPFRYIYTNDRKPFIVNL